MIVLCSFKDEDGKEIADYGWNTEDNTIVILPQLPIFCFQYEFDKESGLRILR